MSDKPGELTFPILQSLHASAVAVSEAEVLSAMKHAFFELKLVAEPGGAAALVTDTIERHHLALDVLVMLALVLIGAGQIR